MAFKEGLRVKVSRLEQNLKEKSPIEATDLPMFTSFNNEHPLKAKEPIEVMLLPSVIVIICDSENAPFPIAVTGTPSISSGTVTSAFVSFINFVIVMPVLSETV